MIYCRTIKEERIAVHPMDNTNNTQFVELTQYGDELIFSVDMYDGENEWCWEFNMNCPSDYERVKLSVFDAIFECDTMLELAEMLDAIFKDGFGTILIEDECDCCNGCSGCKYDC